MTWDHAIFETLWNLPTSHVSDLMSPSASPVVPRRQIGPCVPSLRFEVADGSAVRQNLHSRRLERYRSTSIRSIRSVHMLRHSMKECLQSIRVAELHTVTLPWWPFRERSMFPCRLMPDIHHGNLPSSFGRKLRGVPSETTCPCSSPADKLPMVAG